MTLASAAGIGAGVGLALTFPALGLAAMWAGMDGGSFLAARLCVPYALLATPLTGGEVGMLSLVVAVVQMPVEGALIGVAVARRQPLGTFAVVSAHALAVALCAGLNGFA